MRDFGMESGPSPLSRILWAPLQANLESKTVAAELARELAATYGGKIDCVYADTGILPQVCLALLKTRLPGIICLGYENPKQNSEYFQAGMLVGVMEQDIRQQGRACMEAACAYVTTGQRADSGTMGSIKIL